MGNYNRLQFFAMIGHQSGRNFWYEIVTFREGEVTMRQATNLSWHRARRLCDYLADKYSVADRSGMYIGAIIRTDGKQVVTA